MQKRFCKLYLKRLFEYADLADHYCNYAKAVNIYNKIYILAEFFEEIWPKDAMNWRDIRSRAYRHAEETKDAARYAGEEFDTWLRTYTEPSTESE